MQADSTMTERKSLEEKTRSRWAEWGRCWCGWTNRRWLFNQPRLNGQRDEDNNAYENGIINSSTDVIIEWRGKLNIGDDAERMCNENLKKSQLLYQPISIRQYFFIPFGICLEI